MPDGLRLVEKSNWVGLGIICPRGRYAKVKKRDEFSQSGVYILVGRDSEDDRPTIYIGEAENIRARLDNHYANKDFWQQAIFFTKKGNSLNKAEVQYLEARLVERALTLKRCKLDNVNHPKRSRLSEADEADVTGYLEEMLSLVPVLGIDAFEKTEAPSNGQSIYYLKGKECKGTGFETNNGFAVASGSLARASIVPSLEGHRFAEVREQLVQDGVIVSSEVGLKFSADHEFSSPSQAAAVLMGRNANGRTEWKDTASISLKEHQEREVDT